MFSLLIIQKRANIVQLVKLLHCDQELTGSRKMTRETRNVRSWMEVAPHDLIINNRRKSSNTPGLETIREEINEGCDDETQQHQIFSLQLQRRN